MMSELDNLKIIQRISNKFVLKLYFYDVMIGKFEDKAWK